MERVLCAELEYEVYMPLSYSFLRRFGKCVNADMRLLTIGRFVLSNVQYACIHSYKGGVYDVLGDLNFFGEKMFPIFPKRNCVKL